MFEKGHAGIPGRLENGLVVPLKILIPEWQKADLQGIRDTPLVPKGTVADMWWEWLEAE